MAEKSGLTPRPSDVLIAPLRSAAAMASQLRSRGPSDDIGQQADAACQRAMLKHIAPMFRLVSEEDIESHIFPLDQGQVVVIDPLDGTYGFAQGTDDFVHLAALLEGGRPIAGAIAAPALGIVLRGDDGFGCAVGPLIGTGGWQEIDLTAAKSQTLSTRQSDIDAELVQFCETRGYDDFLPSNSGIGFVQLALGRCSGFLRRHQMRVWDVAALDAIARAGGITLTNLNNEPICYRTAHEFVLGVYARTSPD